MGKGKMSEHSESSGGEEVQVTQKKVESTAVVLDAVAVEKLVMNGGKVLNGLPPTMGGGEEDSGWDGNSSDGSSGVVGDASPSPRPQRTEEQRELRKRRAAAAR